MRTTEGYICTDHPDQQQFSWSKKQAIEWRDKGYKVIEVFSEYTEYKRKFSEENMDLCLDSGGVEFESKTCPEEYLQNRISKLESALIKSRPFIERAIDAQVKENFGYCNKLAHQFIDIRDEIDEALNRVTIDTPNEPEETRL